MKRLRKGWIALTALLATALISFGVSVRSHGHRSLTLPPELAGVWTNDDPRYRDRFLELWPTFVVIVTGTDNPPSVQWIDKVESRPQADGTEFNVYSTDYSQGAEYQMVLRFSPSNGGQLRCGNEPRIWKRRAPASK